MNAAYIKGSAIDGNLKSRSDGPLPRHNFHWESCRQHGTFIGNLVGAMENTLRILPAHETTGNLASAWDIHWEPRRRHGTFIWNLASRWDIHWESCQRMEH